MLLLCLLDCKASLILLMYSRAQFKADRSMETAKLTNKQLMKCWSRKNPEIRRPLSISSVFLLYYKKGVE